MNDENYADIRGNEDAVASEVLSRLSGRNGAERLEQMAERLLAEADGVFEKASAHSLIERIRSAIEQFWSWVGKDLFGITDFSSIEEVQDRVLYDLVKGTDLGLSEVTEADSSSEYQIIGEQGASALDRAEEATIRMDNLRVAREMERAGKDAKTVRLATGWERGADGKWRYEIEDVEIMSISERMNKFLSEQSFTSRIKELKDARWNRDLTEEEEAELSKLLDRQRRATESFFDGNMLHPLDQYVKNDALFEAYPKLREVWINPYAVLPKGTKGKFNPKGSTISIGDNLSEEEVRGVIGHEIQHIIQQMEGFAEGGSPTTKSPEATKEIARLKAKLEELEDKRFDYSPRETRTTAYRNLISEIEHLKDAIEQKKSESALGFEGYRRLAGEVESRNVQTRLDMSAEERRKKLLSETEDVAIKDQIFLMDNAGVAKMAYPYKYDTVEYDKENGTQLTRFIEYLRRGKTLLEGESRFFPIAKAGEILNNYGIIGMITPSTATFNRRHSKEHNLTEKEWKKIAVAINNPLYITQTENHRENDFRVYTPIQRGNEVILVALRIKQQGQNLFVADVRTAFPREISKIKSNEENVLYDRKKEKQRILKESSSGQSQRYISDESVAYSGKDTQVRENKQETSKKSGSSLSSRTVSAMDGHVRGVAERLGLSNVDVVEDGSGLEGRRGKAKGFFDKKTGRITIVLGNHSSVADVERTLLHEAVAHFGLRRLFGDKFDAFLDGVFENVDRSTREAIVALAGRHGWDFRTATEEYLAGIAENMDFERYDAGIWQRIKIWFADMLNALGFDGYNSIDEISDADLRYILWSSYQNLKGENVGVFGEAAAISMKNELGVDEHGEGDVLFRDGCVA